MLLWAKMRQLSLVLKNNLTTTSRCLSIKPFLAIFCPVYSRTVVFVRLAYYNGRSPRQKVYIHLYIIYLHQESLLELD